MNKISFRLKTLTGSILLGLAAPSFAMHLGEPKPISYVGEKLRVEIPIHDTVMEESKDLQAASVAYPYARKFDGHPEYSITVSYKNENPFLIVTSPNIVNDSVLDVAIELKWSGARMIQPVSIVLDANKAHDDIPQTPAVSEPLKIETNSISNNTSSKQFESVENIKVEPLKKPEIESSDLHYKVKSGDTLYSIAKKTKPEDVSIKNWANIIFSANPTAFLGNKNLLLANSHLSINKIKELKSSVVTSKYNQHKYPNKVKHTSKIDKSDVVLREAEQKISKLEVQVKLLQAKSIEIDQLIERLDKNKKSTDKIVTPQKKTGMHLFEGSTKGLLATINAYRSLRSV